MRLPQVSRQPFVGIDLLGQVLGPAPFPLALPVFCTLAVPQFVELIPRYLASFCEPSLQRHTGARRARDKPLALVKDVAFDEAHDFAGTNDSRFSTKLCLPDWPYEVDFQFDGGKRLAFCEGAAVGNAHRGICQIAEHSAMKCPHRVRVSRAGFKLDDGSPLPLTYDHQTQKLADRSGKFFWRHIWELFDNVPIELSLRFRSVRVASQIATELAIRESVSVVVFDGILHH